MKLNIRVSKGEGYSDRKCWNPPLVQGPFGVMNIEKAEDMSDAANQYAVYFGYLDGIEIVSKTEDGGRICSINH